MQDRSGVLLAALNLLIRAHLAWFLFEVMTHQDDPRFAGKAIPIRNLVIVGGMSMLFPVAHFVFKRWGRYPWGWDALYVSVYWLDMAGNSFDLYDSYTHFDVLPHIHGTGTFAVIFEHAFGIRVWPAILWANVFHGGLEAQENLTDVFLGTHNVRGWWDTALDMLAGVLGTLAYPALGRKLGLRPAGARRDPR